MPVPRPETSDSRIIAHVDMDCFYVQVEQRANPKLRGLPTAVVQYNEWKGGALIAVSYEARKFGVKRSMRGDEAKKVCPEIQLVQVPTAHEKADLSGYRNAGSEVVAILSRKGRCERASIDEVYLDLTDAAKSMLIYGPPDILEAADHEALKSHILGIKKEGKIDREDNIRNWLCRTDAEQSDKLLACGAFIVAELRMQVLKETEFTCSAGIAHNKMLAKLASAMNKPAQQTVVPSASVKELLDSTPISKMKQLGGKLGSQLQCDLNVRTVGDLLQFSAEKLQEHYGANTGLWLWNVARGICGEEVCSRLLPKSHGSGKSFPGPRALMTIDSVHFWLNKLCEELSERLYHDFCQNKRMAHTLTLYASAHRGAESHLHKKFPSKSCKLRFGTAKIQEDIFKLFKSGLREYMCCNSIGECDLNNKFRITALSISASRIFAIPAGTGSITKYFDNKHSANHISGPKTKPIPFPTQEASPFPRTDYGIDLVRQPDYNNFSTLNPHEERVTFDPSFFNEPSSSSSANLAQDSMISSIPAFAPTKRKQCASSNSGTILEMFRKHRAKEVSSIGINNGVYEREEIDMSIVNELPPEIRDEILCLIQSRRRPRVPTRGTALTRYFVPMRSSRDSG